MALETCRSHIHSNLNFDQNEIYFKKILIPFFYPVVFSYCIGSGYILLEVISKMRLRAHGSVAPP
jgi:hypothetical protein